MKQRLTFGVPTRDTAKYLLLISSRNEISEISIFILRFMKFHQFLIYFAGRNSNGVAFILTSLLVTIQYQEEEKPNKFKLSFISWFSKLLIDVSITHSSFLRTMVLQSQSFFSGSSSHQNWALHRLYYFPEHINTKNLISRSKIIKTVDISMRYLMTKRQNWDIFS